MGGNSDIQFPSSFHPILSHTEKGTVGPASEELKMSNVKTSMTALNFFLRFYSWSSLHRCTGGYFHPADGAHLDLAPGKILPKTTLSISLKESIVTEKYLQRR